MPVKKSKKKTLYWHPIGKELISRGLLPKHIKAVFDEIFPQNNITTRKIGAFKRRLVDEGLEIDSDTNMNDLQAMLSWAKENVSEDDQWIHQLVVNSAMAELRVFAFQTKETIDEKTELDKFEEWINARVL